ncbi:hypothetical protein BdWA1_000888 [Babesia duncani]|uniref:Uncharacterized protein n=1 Tax=Babesia duncani TaxID=323732 RepID=A0AAD9UMB2_9APIC|nr:hypothetical protein BdWA1_003693 [Babesia duncani]KAK2197885.1 hypothetical protein BdWA1_000888 [Babesia duncani]
MSSRLNILKFDNVVAILKQLANGSVLVNSAKERIGSILPSIESNIREHPFHAPVLVHHLARAINASPRGSFGAYHDVYTSLVPVLESAIPLVDPKGLSNLLSIYSCVKTAHAAALIEQLELRCAYMMYIGCSRVTNDLNLLESHVAQFLHVYKQESKFKFLETKAIQETDYLSTFLNLSQSKSDLIKESKYQLWINLRDVCAIVTSIRKESILKDLVLYLSRVYITSTDIYKNPADAKSSSRILLAHHKFGYKHPAIGSVLIKMLNECHQILNAKDICNLIHSLSDYKARVKDLDLGSLTRRIAQILKNDVEIKCIKTASVVCTSLSWLASLELDNAERLNLLSLIDAIAIGACNVILRQLNCITKKATLAGINIIASHLKGWTRINRKSSNALEKLLMATCTAISQNKPRITKELLYEYNLLANALISLVNESKDLPQTVPMKDCVKMIMEQSCRLVDALLGQSIQAKVLGFNENTLRDICHFTKVASNASINYNNLEDIKALALHVESFLHLFKGEINKLDAKDLEQFINAAQRWSAGLCVDLNTNPGTHLSTDLGS